MKYKSSVIIIFIILILFCMSYFIPNIKMKNSENRTYATFGMIFHPDPDSVVYHDSPVERLDAALSDQFAFRELIVNNYLSFMNSSESFTYKISRQFTNVSNEQYSLHSIGQYELIDDTEYLTIFPEVNKFDEKVLDKRKKQITYIHDKYNLNMYVYYVTQAYDTSWFDSYIGIKSADHYEEIKNILPNYIKTDYLVYEDLYDYMNIHYKTDHHWNHEGAKRGYESIYKMLSKDIDLGDMKSPKSLNKNSITYDYKYLGSYGQILGDLYKGGYDEFSFYEYDLPSRSTYIIDSNLKEIKATKIGLMDEYINGDIDKDIGKDHYINMYGTAKDESGNSYADTDYSFVIKNNNSNKENLLMISDSYGRAIRDVLASHFNTTVYIDYRVLNKVPIDYLIEKYNITTILMNSNKTMWGNNEYFFTFRGDE